MMAMRARLAAAAALLVLPALSAPAQTPAAAPPAGDSFYAKSLHFTNRGIEFVYGKENGGLERLTGLPAAAIGCVKAECHATSCDACHRKDADGKAAYTADPAVAQAACERCHGGPASDDPDVHARKGMRCMSCHTTREVHGDGAAYDTYSQPGVLDARCETCHSGLTPSPSHAIHRATVACPACHAARAETCLNCHVETRLGGGKETKIPVSGMVFLVNHDGKVTTANLLTYVYQDGTMITLAPTFAHSIGKQGRTCAECHGSANVRAIAAGTFTPVRWADGKLAADRGVIPVVDPLAWRLPFLDRKDGAWVPLAGARPPLVNFSANCSPITREQLAKLAQPRRAQ